MPAGIPWFFSFLTLYAAAKRARVDADRALRNIEKRCDKSSISLSFRQRFTDRL
jgi:hypothetical protein